MPDRAAAWRHAAQLGFVKLAAFRSLIQRRAHPYGREDCPRGRPTGCLAVHQSRRHQISAPIATGRTDLPDGGCWPTKPLMSCSISSYTWPHSQPGSSGRSRGPHPEYEIIRIGLRKNYANEAPLNVTEDALAIRTSCCGACNGEVT